MQTTNPASAAREEKDADAHVLGADVDEQQAPEHEDREDGRIEEPLHHERAEGAHTGHAGAVGQVLRAQQLAGAQGQQVVARVTHEQRRQQLSPGEPWLAREQTAQRALRTASETANRPSAGTT